MSPIALTCTSAQAFMIFAVYTVTPTKLGLQYFLLL